MVQVLDVMGCFMAVKVLKDGACYEMAQVLDVMGCFMTVKVLKDGACSEVRDAS